MSLPSNKIGVLLLTVVVVVSGVISTTSYMETKDLEVPDRRYDADGNPIVTIKVDNDETGHDEDGDGLLDWEETLWGTNPKAVDSDGDGTSDGAEVAAGRDPKVAGPNDSQEALFQQKINDVPLFYEHYVPGTLTDNLSVNLAKNYLDLKQGQSYTEETGQDLVNAIISDVSQITSYTQTQYTTADISTFSNDLQLAKGYGEQMADIRIKRLLQIDSYENYNEDLYLEILQEFYLDYANELSLMYVPAEVVSDHVRIINNYTVLSSVINDMRNYQTDPVKALLAIRTYQEVAVTQSASYEQIGAYFSRNDILFEGKAAILWQ